MTIDHADLRAKAEAATAGPWQIKSIAGRTRNNTSIFGVFGPSEIIAGLDGIVMPDSRNDRSFLEDNANAAFIAAANPATVLELLAERDRLRAALEESEDKIDGLAADLSSAVETAFKRGAVEWTRLNYPMQYIALTTGAHDE